MALFRKKTQKVKTSLTPHAALKAWLDKGFFNPTCHPCNPSMRYHDWHELLPLITPVAQALLACPQLEIDSRGEEILYINTVPARTLPVELQRLTPEGDIQWEGLAISGDILRDLRLFFRDSRSNERFMAQISIQPSGLVEYTLLMRGDEASRAEMMRSIAGIVRVPHMTIAYRIGVRHITAPSREDVLHLMTHLPAYLRTK